MQRSEFSYRLPKHLIAQRPPPERGDSRLLVLAADTGKIAHERFADLPRHLCENDLLVFNDTRVIPARLWGRKSTGGKVEILVERLTGTHTALAHIRASKAPSAGSFIRLCRSPDVDPGTLQLEVTGRQDDLFEISSRGGHALAEIMAELGHMPLPPYIRRNDEFIDRERYQTVYARSDGAVAAPTAGLHFTPELIAQIDQAGVRRATVTLHVGAGTFQPVREENIENHIMHRELIEIDESVCDAVRETRARGGRVVAVGTTVVRALESASSDEGVLRSFRGDTDIFIYPGYQFRTVDALLTNFHLPESTLLMLVCAFAGHKEIMAAYAEAIECEYRFFSYGDAMLVNPGAVRKPLA